MEEKLEVLLPHGPGFHFVDEVISVVIEDDKMEAVTRWTYTGDEPGASDHFPGELICPGIWIQEHQNQSLIQIGQRIPGVRGCIFTLLTLDGFRMKKPVRTGSTIKTRVAITKLKHPTASRMGFGTGTAESSVNEEVVASAEKILFGIVPAGQRVTG
jgi:3-hydroxymyristoyl/3-hydroxydecanoyl-(acyl carrier protein) dehydratase